jgi:NAD(P)-dependent dehydrogenase (short-subunit alcohol dehydrogenase family)
MPARASPWHGHVLITGAGSGIGAELARAAARRGATALSLVDLNAGAAKTVAAELQAAHPGLAVSIFETDVSSYPAVKKAVDGSVAAHGPVCHRCGHQAAGL